MPHFSSASALARSLLDRRRFLSDAATGLGSIALLSLLGRDPLQAAEAATIDPARPYLARPKQKM